MDLTIETVRDEAGYLVILSGEVDAFTGPRVKKELLALVEKPEARRIAVDLRQVGYMDSTGIGVFVAVMKACKKAGSQLLVQNTSPRVDRLFRLTGFYDVLAARKGESK